MELPSVKPILEKDFVTCWIDTDRMTGGEELLTKLRGDVRGGIPWFVVQEPDGTAVKDADDLSGGNLGCPHTEEEVKIWGRFLAATRLRITDAEIATVVEAFQAAGARGPIVAAPVVGSR
jgi:hypothetical protein